VAETMQRDLASVELWQRSLERSRRRRAAAQHHHRRAPVVLAGVLSAGALAVGATQAWAEPSPPTNGGNGAGQSGQCTGPQDDRPASCQSQGGPGNQP
jgi:hypothetical protein